MKKLKHSIIKTLTQYNEYCETLETLVLQDYNGNLEEIELLTLLIEYYDQQQMEMYRRINCWWLYHNFYVVDMRRIIALDFNRGRIGMFNNLKVVK